MTIQYTIGGVKVVTNVNSPEMWFVFKRSLYEKLPKAVRTRMLLEGCLIPTGAQIAWIVY